MHILDILPYKKVYSLVEEIVEWTADECLILGYEERLLQLFLPKLYDFMFRLS